MDEEVTSGEVYQSGMMPGGFSLMPPMDPRLHGVFRPQQQLMSHYGVLAPSFFSPTNAYLQRRPRGSDSRSNILLASTSLPAYHENTGEYEERKARRRKRGEKEGKEKRRGKIGKGKEGRVNRDW